MAVNQGATRVVLLNALSAVSAQSIPFDASGRTDLVGYLTGTGTTSSGVVTIEEADYGPNDPIFGGTWSLITTLNASDVTGGQQLAYHFPLTAYGAIRARISTGIGGGGTVSFVLRGV